MMLTPPASGMPDAVQLVVPDAAPLPPRLLTQVTDAMPVSSVAVPASVMLDASEVKVGSAVGEVMVMTGGAPDGVGHVHRFDVLVRHARGAADDDAAAERLHGLALAVEVQRVELGAAVERQRARGRRADGVVAGARVDADRGERRQAGPDGDDVVAAESVGEHGLGRADVHGDGARLTEERDALAVGRDVHRVDAVAAVELERVVAGLAVDRLAAVARVPDHQVVAGAAVVRIDAGAARQRVVAGAAVQRVVAGVAVEDVDAVAAGQDVVAVAAVHARHDEAVQADAAGDRDRCRRAR